MTEQVATASCREPLDRRGARLCGVCRLATDVEGLRRCARVVAESPAMRDLLVRAARFAPSSAPVVISGESGTGKEVVARLLHANSPRARGPFVAVNVAALPLDLLESELFGHVKGAFTGAGDAKEGLLEAAHGGTLFLDEIGDMPAALQPKLLRALQDGEVRRVGAVKAREVDVRILCATHRDLPALVAGGGFRQDLWYRLKVFSLRVPALRERREDILPLFRTLLDAEGPVLALAPAAARLLEAWSWPGNVRELANAARHAAALAGDGPIELEHLPEELLGPPPSARGDLRRLEDVEREHVLRVLQAVGGHEEAARVLGIGRTTLWRKLRAWGLGG